MAMAKPFGAGIPRGPLPGDMSAGNKPTSVTIGTRFHEENLNDIRAQARESLSSWAQASMDKAAFDAMAAGPGHMSVAMVGDVQAIQPTAMELDNEILRDHLVDMCSATQPGTPPSQEDWDQIRDMVKAAAVKHALLVRDEKKSVKKFEPSQRNSVAMPPRHGKSQMITSMLPAMLSSSGLDGSKPLSGHSAGLLIVDDVIKEPWSIGASSQMTQEEFDLRR